MLRLYGTMITALRKKHKFSQKELGDHLGIGVSSISLWEQGKREPSLQHLKEMAELFGVSTDYLLFGQEDDRKITKQEGEILDLFAQLPEEKQHEVKGIMKGIILGEK